MIAPAQRAAVIFEKLTAAFSPRLLRIEDDSQQHAGHASAGGAGHFTIQIVADAFAGKSPVQRHRMIYAALADLMPEHIHALSIRASTPAETAN